MRKLFVVLAIMLLAAAPVWADANLKNTMPRAQIPSKVTPAEALAVKNYNQDALAKYILNPEDFQAYAAVKQSLALTVAKGATTLSKNFNNAYCNLVFLDGVIIRQNQQIIEQNEKIIRLLEEKKGK